MEIREFQKLNRTRANSFAAETAWGQSSNRNLIEWALCVGGETGELLNMVKKACLYHGEEEMTHEEREEIGKEMADIVTYCMLMFSYLGMDAETATLKKFNEVNERIGYNVRVAV